MDLSTVEREELVREVEALRNALLARERSEAAFRESEERFRVLADTAPVGVYLTDANGHCTWVNRRWLQMTGLDLAQALGDGWLQGVHPEDRARIRRGWKRMIASEGRKGLSYRFKTPTGRVTDVYGLATPLHDATGGVFGYVGTNTDLSELHQAQDRLRQSEEKYRAIVETQPDGFVMLDRRGRLLEVNDAYAGRSGFSRDELLSMGIADLEAKESLEEVSAHAARVIAHGSDLFETLHRAKDGTVWPVEISTSYWPIGQGRLFAFIRDLKRRKLVELLLRTRLRLSELAAHATLDEVLQQALDDAELLTGSRISFFLFVEADQVHLTLQTWSTNTLRNMCTAEGKGQHYSINHAGVWVDCVRAGEPVIHNDYATLNHKRGLPPGHAPVVRELVVPIFEGDRLAAILGVGNKATDYTEDDIEPVLQIGSLVMDLAARKQAERRLRESEERYHSLFENSPVAVLEQDFSGLAKRLHELREAGVQDLPAHLTSHPEEVGDLAGRVRFLDLNRAALRLLGQTSKEAALRSLPAYLYGESPTAFAEQVSALTSGRESLNFELPIVGVPDAPRLLDLHLAVVPGHARDLSRVLVSLLDVTDSRRAFLALQDSEKRLREISASVPGALYQFAMRADGSFAVPFMSESATDLLERPLEHLMDPGRLFRDLHPEDAEAFFASIAGSAASQEPWIHEFRANLCRSGTTRWIQGRSIPHREADGATVWTGVLVDVTERRRQEEALREQEHRYRSLLESTQTVPWEMDIRSGRFTYMGPQAEEIFGYPLASWIDMQTWVDRIHPEDRETAVRTCGEATSQGEDHSFEYRLLRADGQILWVLDEVSVVSGRAGPERLLGFMRDITAAKAAQGALEASEQRYRNLFTGMLEGVAVHEILTDQEGEPVDYRFLAVNPEFERLTGVSAATVVGRTVLEVFPDTERHWIEIYGRVALTGEPTRFEKVHQGLGKRFEVSAYCPAPRQFVAVFKDVTAERRAREERDRLFNQSLDLLCIAELTGRLREVNPAWTRTLGWSAEELTSRPWIELVHPDDHERSVAQGARLLRGKASVRFENRYRTRDGSYRWLSWNSIPILEEGIALCVVRDVTEVKQQEAIRLQLEEQLRQSQKMEAIGTLAGGIAHDFNNILTPIIGHAELAMAQLPASSPVADELSQLLVSAERAKDLVRQILAISRKEEGRTAVPVALGALVKEVAKFLRATLPTTIEIHAEVDPNCTPILGDPSRLHQVLLNLATNARDAMEGQGGKLTLALEPVAEGRGPERRGGNLATSTGWARLEVRDTGCGIPPNALNRIFEPYFTTKPVGKGTGLGLAVAHGVVNSLGGEIRVQSALGSGTTFEVFLPCVAAAEGMPSSKAPPIPRGSGETVLVVDDEAPVRTILAKLLEALGYRVLVFGSGREALEAFRAAPDGVDLVLTDYTMPEWTGPDLAAQLLRIRPDLPVLLCTGFAESVDEESARAMGFRGLVLKPYTMQRLGNAVASGLDPASPAATPER